eukprot:gene21299-50866_t
MAAVDAAFPGRRSAGPSEAALLHDPRPRRTPRPPPAGFIARAGEPPLRRRAAPPPVHHPVLLAVALGGAGDTEAEHALFHFFARLLSLLVLAGRMAARGDSVARAGTLCVVVGVDPGSAADRALRRRRRRWEVDELRQGGARRESWAL